MKSYWQLLVVSAWCSLLIKMKFLIKLEILHTKQPFVYTLDLRHICTPLQGKAIPNVHIPFTFLSIRECLLTKWSTKHRHVYFYSYASWTWLRENWSGKQQWLWPQIDGNRRKPKQTLRVSLSEKPLLEVSHSYKRDLQSHLHMCSLVCVDSPPLLGAHLVRAHQSIYVAQDP